MRRNLGRCHRKRLGRARKTFPIAKHKGKHYIYKITVDNKYYIGYSSRPVDIRLKEHIRKAKSGHRSKFYNKLRRCNYKYCIETLHEFEEEYWALVEEVKLINTNTSGLNTSPGGEGRTIKVMQITDGNGDIQYKTI